MAIELHLKQNDKSKSYWPLSLSATTKINQPHWAQKQFYAEKSFDKQAFKDYIDEDIYFYDLYITYHNFHQDTLVKDVS